MKTFRIIEIKPGEIAVSLDRATGHIPVPDVSALSQDDALDAYIRAVADATTLNDVMVRSALKAYLQVP